MSYYHTANQLPHEILLSIFSELCPEHEFLNNTYPWLPKEKGAPGPRSPHQDVQALDWHQSTRNFREIARVCRTWWSAAMPILYSNVAIRHIGQLPSLIRTLERTSKFHFRTSDDSTFDRNGSEDSEVYLKYGYGVWIKRIHIVTFIPREWFSLYRMQLLRLFDLCPSLQSFSHRPALDNQIPMEFRATILHVLTHRVPQHLKKTRELTVSDITLDERDMGLLKNLSLFHCLTQLEIEIRSIYDSQRLANGPISLLEDEGQSPDNLEIVLSTLETLVLRITDYRDYLRLNKLTKLFSFPSLHHLTIDCYLYYGPNNLPVTQIELLLFAYGSQLLTLYFGFGFKGSIEMTNLYRLTSNCPKLTHVAYSTKNFSIDASAEDSPSSQPPTTYTSLQHVTLLIHRPLQTFLKKYDARNLNNQLLSFSDRSAFPRLSSISVVDPCWKGNDPPIKNLHFHHFLSQRSISALSKVGIQLWCHHGLSRAWPYQPIDEISLEDYHDDDESSEVEDEPLFSDSLPSDGEFDAKGFSYDTFPLPDKMVELREGELLRVFKNIQEWMG